jgi:hypothetical protein
MGLKGYRLWVMGQLDSNVQSPTAAARVPPMRVGTFHSRYYCASKHIQFDDTQCGPRNQSVTSRE